MWRDDVHGMDAFLSSCCFVRVGFVERLECLVENCLGPGARLGLSTDTFVLDDARIEDIL